MGTIAILLAGVAGGMVLGAVGFAVVRYRRLVTSEAESLPANVHHVVDLLRRVHGASAACVVVQNTEPVWSRAFPPPAAAMLERAKIYATLALGDGREHIGKEQNLVVALGDGRVGCAVLFGGPDANPGIVDATLADLRRVLAEFQLARAREIGTLEDRRSAPDWLTPDTIEGIGAGLCEAVRRATGLPTAVVVRDPLTEQAEIVAVSAGADRRLTRITIAPTSVVGRACMSDFTAVGRGGELFGVQQQNRRRREATGIVYSLADGTRSVGALVVFGEKLDPAVNREVKVLVEEAGPHIARAAALYGAKHRAMTDELTGQPNRRALTEALEQRGRGECSLLRVHVDQLTELEHRAASAVLRHVAVIFRRSLRDYDVAARVDDEFALYLPDTPFHHAVGVADRVRIAVSESIFDWAGREFLITCSFGVASVPDESASTDSLVAAADTALRTAKSKGRNRISAVHPELN